MSGQRAVSTLEVTLADRIAMRYADLRLWAWQKWHRCSCLYGLVPPPFDDDNIACRLGFHPEGCPGGHTGMVPCPRHGQSATEDSETPGGSQ